MLIRLISGVLVLVYPLIVYLGMQRFDAILMLPLVASVLALRWFSVGQGKERLGVAVVFAGLITVVLTWDPQLGLLLYPLLVNMSFLAFFGSSLFSSQTVVEKLARLTQPDLPQQAVAYTRKVTQIWCVFFVINGAISAYTAIYSSHQMWLLYNGLIAYVAIGTLIAVEWLVRKKVMAIL